jgi:hypothetical protein
LVLQETKSEPISTSPTDWPKLPIDWPNFLFPKKTIDWPVTPIDWPGLKCDFQKINDVFINTNVFPKISLHIQT